MSNLEQDIINANLEHLQNPGTSPLNPNKLAANLKVSLADVVKVLNESIKYADLVKIRKIHGGKPNFREFYEKVSQEIQGQEAQTHPFMTKSEESYTKTYDKNSRVLILGSFPPLDQATKSYKGFYYGDKTNKFWVILGEIFKVDLNIKDDKEEFLRSKNIALLDIFAKCFKFPKDSSEEKAFLSIEAKW